MGAGKAFLKREGERLKAPIARFVDQKIAKYRHALCAFEIFRIAKMDLERGAGRVAHHAHETRFAGDEIIRQCT